MLANREIQISNHSFGEPSTKLKERLYSLWWLRNKEKRWSCLINNRFWIIPFDRCSYFHMEKWLQTCSASFETYLITTACNSIDTLSQRWMRRKLLKTMHLSIFRFMTILSKTWYCSEFVNPNFWKLSKKIDVYFYIYGCIFLRMSNFYNFHDTAKSDLSEYNIFIKID